MVAQYKIGYNCKDTIADVTDAFDEDVSTVEQTLTAGKDAEDFVDIPDLPRDSKGNTPAQSGGESSVETTPLSKRKLSPKEEGCESTVPHWLHEREKNFEHEI